MIQLASLSSCQPTSSHPLSQLLLHSSDAHLIAVRLLSSQLISSLPLLQLLVFERRSVAERANLPRRNLSGGTKQTIKSQFSSLMPKRTVEQLHTTLISSFPITSIHIPSSETSSLPKDPERQNAIMQFFVLATLLVVSSATAFANPLDKRTNQKANEYASTSMNPFKMHS